MTIQQTADYILKHPFFKEAIRKYIQEKDDADIKHLLGEVQIHVWDTVTRCAAKEYGRNKWGQHQDIREKLRDLPPPDTLDIRLPIPCQPELPFGKTDY